MPGLLTQWFPPDAQGSDNAAARQAASQRRAAEKVRRAEDREKAALELLLQQVMFWTYNSRYFVKLYHLCDTTQHFSGTNVTFHSERTKAVTL